MAELVYRFRTTDDGEKKVGLSFGDLNGESVLYWLRPRYDLLVCETGFQWGIDSDGSKLTALTVCADVLHDGADKRAFRSFMSFCKKFIVRERSLSFNIPEAVIEQVIDEASPDICRVRAYGEFCILPKRHLGHHAAKSGFIWDRSAREFS